MSEAPTTNPLIVPIRVAVMPISSADAGNVDGSLSKAMAGCYAVTQADFSALGSTDFTTFQGFTSDIVVKSPLADFAQTLNVGMNIHWNLPAALRSGQIVDGKLVMPPAPNRWIVTRIVWPDAANDTQAAPVISCQMVWSDALASSSSPTTTFPVGYETIKDGLDSGASSMPLYSSVGQSGPISSPPKYFLPDLTALGYGNPNFSTYLPNCYNVFGLLDTPPPGGSISYAVFGWYSDLTCDPVSPTYQSPGSKTAGADIPKAWQPPAGGSTPTQSLFFGFWSGTEWNQQTYQGTKAWTFGGNLTLGNSPTEALSALIASGQAKPAEAEMLMNALQAGLMNAEKEAGFEEAVSTNVFSRAFSLHHGGSVWRAKGSATRLMKVAASDGASLPEVQSLNAVQAEYDEAVNVLRNRQTVLFTSWYQFQKSLGGQNYPQYSNLVHQYVEETTHWHKRVADLTQQLKSARTAAESASAQLGLTLSEEPIGHGAFPADHTLLLSGDGVTPLPPDSNASTAVPCLIGSLLTASPPQLNFIAKLVGDSAAGSLPASAMPSDPDLAGLASAGGGAVGTSEFGPVLLQALLQLDPQGSTYVANLTASAGSFGAGPNPAVLDMAATVSAIKTSMQDLFGGTVPTGVGTSLLPTGSPIGLTAYQNAAFGAPIMLAWQCSVSYPKDFQSRKMPDGAPQGGYRPDDLLRYYRWTSDGLELELDLQKKPEMSGDWQWEGWVPLSPNITTSLVQELNLFEEYNKNQNIADLAQKIAGKPFLAQTISGFHRGLGATVPSMQLPIISAYAGNSGPMTGEQVAPLMRGGPRLTPVAENRYSPVRAGMVTLDALVVVDEFGRITKLSPTSIVFPKTIEPSNDVGEPSFYPTVRLSQASRLTFAALTQSFPPPPQAGEQDVSTGPIAGWIVPNMLERSLMFYEPDGRAIGSLWPVGEDDGSPIWAIAPGRGQVGEAMSRAFAKCPVLYAIAMAIVAGRSGYLRQIFDAIATAMMTIAPPVSDTNTTSLLVGRPLAVVQAEASMDVLGGILPSPTPLSAGGGLQLSDYGLGELRFPVRLGSACDPLDGLVGFFCLQGDNPAPYATFYSDGANADEPQPAGASVACRPRFGQPFVTPGGAKTSSERAIVTMLVAPGGSVRAVNGISPPTGLSLAKSDYEQALKRMSFALPVMPVLAPANPFEGLTGIPMPVPKGVSPHWSFAAALLDGWQTVPVTAVPAPELPTPPVAATDGWLLFKGKA